MRRREAVVIALVLVPFAALVGAAWLADASPPGATEVVVDGGAMDLTSLHSSTPEVTNAVTDASVPSSPTPFPRELRAALGAIAPAVHDCQRDTSRSGTVEPVVVAFRTTSQGRFVEVRVEPGAHDPRLVACIEDAFAEVQFTPSGDEPDALVRYAF